MSWHSHIIVQSCADIILMAQHSLGTFKIRPISCWHSDFLSYLPVNPVWILLVIAHTHTEDISAYLHICRLTRLWCSLARRVGFSTVSKQFPQELGRKLSFAC